MKNQDGVANPRWRKTHVLDDRSLWEAPQELLGGSQKPLGASQKPLGAPRSLLGASHKLPKGWRLEKRLPGSPESARLRVTTKSPGWDF